jgi:hypothetical protein
MAAITTSAGFPNGGNPYPGKINGNMNYSLNFETVIAHELVIVSVSPYSL